MQQLGRMAPGQLEGQEEIEVQPDCTDGLHIRPGSVSLDAFLLQL